MFSTSSVSNMSRLLSSWLLTFFVTSSLLHAAPCLTVAAASDLSSLGPQLETVYKQQHPGQGLCFVFSSSATLRQQIAASAPFDVFLSANAGYVDELATAGTITPASVIVYAQGRVGVLWRDGQKHPLREITTPLVKFLALPNPKLAPYGVAAQQALEYGGLWSMVQNKVVYAENVRQALQLVESGNADAVLTADSLLKGKNADVLPADWHKPIIQKGGIVANTKQRQAAGQFLQFLLSPSAQAVFADFGFSPPQP